MNKLATILTLASIGIIFAAPAEAKTAGELKTECLAVNIQADIETKLQFETEGECRGYIHGAMEALTVYFIALPGAKTPGTYSYVLAPGVNTGQAAVVFLKYIAAHSEEETKSAPLVLRDAMAEAGLLVETLVPEKTAKATPTSSKETPAARACRLGYTHCS